MRTIHKAIIPSSGASYLVGRRQVRSGSGVGAVLLDGGLGGQSSYSSLDDYMSTTGVNPYAKQIPSISTTGKGLAKMNAQLENLAVKIKKGKKPSNIKFSL